MQDREETGRLDDPQRAYRVLIADLVGLRFDAEGRPDPGEVRAHVTARGGVFHEGGYQREDLPPGIHFFYQPDLSAEAEIIAQTADGRYDALIAAATFIPKQAVFPLGGVRIGAGTGNMGSASWGGGNGEGGAAPLMNTPGINSRATAQMAMKALLKVTPDLPVDLLHARVVGACQAVDQIIDVIRHRRVVNLKGSLPEGYVDAGAKAPQGIGRVTAATLAAAAIDPRFAELHGVSREITDTLEAIVEAVAEGMTHQPAKGDVAALTHLLLRQRRLLEALGLDGPAET